jgi:hypothetical protein
MTLLNNDNSSVKSSNNGNSKKNRPSSIRLSSEDFPEITREIGSSGGASPFDCLGIDELFVSLEEGKLLNNQEDGGMGGMEQSGERCKQQQLLEEQRQLMASLEEMNRLLHSRSTEEIDDDDEEKKNYSDDQKNKTTTTTAVSNNPLPIYFPPASANRVIITISPEKDLEEGRTVVVSAETVGQSQQGKLKGNTIIAL